MKRIEFISFEEFQKLYRNCKSKSLRLCILLGFGSGLRISEILGLKEQITRCCHSEIIKKKSLILGGKQIKKYCAKCGKELTSKDIIRGSKWKIPPLTPDKIDISKHQVRVDVAKGNKWRVTVAVPALNQKMVDILPLKIPRRTIQYRFTALAKKILGKKMSIHTLRHGFGNYQANVLRVPLPIVQQMMGHSRLDVTGIYTKANPEFAIQTAWKAMGGE